MIERVLIIGTGLIGASTGLALRAAGFSGGATRGDSTLLDASACRGTTYRSSKTLMLRWQSDLRSETAERAGWQLHMQICERQRHRTGIDPTKSPHRGIVSQFENGENETVSGPARMNASKCRL